VSLTGAGQTVAIYSDNFWISVDDINKFQDTNGISPRVPVQVKLVQPLTELPPAWGGIETVLDAEMAIAMAPGLSQVIIYMGDMTTALNQAANEALAKQISVSYSGIPNDDSYEAIMMQFAAEGITVVASSGDDGAYYPTVPQWQSSPSVTIVGGTVLTTASPAGKWISEQVWNPGGGGISASYSGSVPIPTWQANISTAQNGASKTMRNSPDVAMVASNVSFYWRGDGNGAATVAEGTSVSAPLWAGVIALANQRAAALKKPSVGAINRAIYTIGLGANAGKLLHDITVGNNVTPDNTQPGAANQWDAVAGYDMASGLGTPVGEALLEALVTPNVPPPPVNCVATKELIASLQMQRDKAESQLGTPLCDGPASYECVQRIKALQAEISAETLFYNENCSH
jgi:subtilase family serine protease